MAEIPTAPVTRLLILEEYGEQVAAKSVSLAKHAGRKTVKAEDVLEAVA
jgi:histone H3/H4